MGQISSGVGLISGLPINDIIDKLYMGWLVRTLYDPKKFFFRTLKSLYFFKIFLKS